VARSLGDHLLIRLEPVVEDEQSRDVEVSASGGAWASRWGKLQAALSAVEPC